MIQKNKFGLIWSFILKVMNFLIFRDFSQIIIMFMNLFEFIGIYFEFKRIKKSD